MLRYDHPMLIIKHGDRGNGRDTNGVLPAAGASGYNGRQWHFRIPNFGELLAEGMRNRVGD